MTHKAVHDPDRERFPEYHDHPDVREDPARYLDTELVERGAADTATTGRDLALARIRGIDKLGVVNAWIQVERQLERGPRKAVIEALEDRRDHLLENGERHPEVAARVAERARARGESENDPEDQPDQVWEHEECGSTDVERESKYAWRCHECDVRTNRVERVDLDNDEPDDAGAEQEVTASG